MLLIKNGRVAKSGGVVSNDILCGGGRILHCDANLQTDHKNLSGVIDAKNCFVVPGFIDPHTHIAGAGGEGGPATRTPEMFAGQFFSSGITTTVGCLGTDGITRSPRSVLMKAKALNEDGLTTFMYTGAYQLPTPTITGDVADDIALIGEIIGAGEIALSDHRSSAPGITEIAKIAAKARVGGMLGGKAGIVNIHMGDAKDPFRPLLMVADTTDIPLKQFIPTHINRNKHIFEDAKSYGKNGFIDITTSSYPYYREYEVKPSKAYAQLLEAGVPVNHITMSSDAGGSLPDFDEQGNLTNIQSGSPDSQIREFRDLIFEEKFEIWDALAPFTRTTASNLKLYSKGCIEKDYDADLLILDKELNIKAVVARGKIVFNDYKLLKTSNFEK